MTTAARQSLKQIFLIPAILAVLSTGGLIFALIEDGIWDALSWIALSIPIVLYVSCIANGGRQRQGRRWMRLTSLLKSTQMKVANIKHLRLRKNNSGLWNE
jgi:cell division protein FtsW (lipid II flippase)